MSGICQLKNKSCDWLQRRLRLAEAQLWEHAFERMDRWDSETAAPLGEAFSSNSQPSPDSSVALTPPTTTTTAPSKNSAVSSRPRPAPRLRVSGSKKSPTSRGLSKLGWFRNHSLPRPHLAKYRLDRPFHPFLLN